MRGAIIAIAAGFAVNTVHAANVAPEYPLDVRFVEWHADGKHALHDMPVTVTDAKGDVVIQGKSKGPEFRAQLPKGRYTVTTRWDDWTFSRTVNVGTDQGTVLFAWDTPEASASAIG